MTNDPECPALDPITPPLQRWQFWRRFRWMFARQHVWNEPWGSVTCVRCGTRAYVEYGR